MIINIYSYGSWSLNNNDQSYIINVMGKHVCEFANEWGFSLPVWSKGSRRFTVRKQ